MSSNPTYDLMTLESIPGLYPSIPMPSSGFPTMTVRPPFPPYIEHPWLSPEDGLSAYTRVMRGEDRLTHYQCGICRDMFQKQIEFLRAQGVKVKFKRKDPGDRKMSRRRGIVRSLLQSVAKRASL